MIVAELIAQLKELPQNMLVLVYSPYDDSWVDADLRTEIRAVKLPQTEQQPYNTYRVFDSKDPDDDMIVLHDDEIFVDAVDIW